MKNTLKETRKMVMVKAHAMCREMKDQGFEFNYHVQLGLNIKYLWEVIGETVDTMVEEEATVNTTVEEQVMEDTVEEIEVEDTVEYDEEEEYDKYEEYVEYVVEDTEEEEEEEIVENTEDNSEYKLGEKFEEHECTETFCGSCLMDTLQYREGGEVVCTECGERWELIPYEEYKVLNKYAQFVEDEEDEEEEDDYTLECVNYVSLPDNAGYSFLFKLHLGDTIQEFVAFANQNHRLPVIFDADPNDSDLHNRVKNIIDEETGLYSNLLNDYVPDCRYTRKDDYFIYFDEAAGIFKGYYCGNDVYGGRAFVFDINSKEGPCSRSVRQLIKDHKAGNFGKYTTMNGKGTTITKWRDKLLEECRALYKLSKNNTQIEEAKAVLDRPWLYNEVKYNAALRFLAKMNVKYDSKYESYDAAIDAKLMNLSENYDSGNKFNKAADKLIVKFQDRIRALKLTNLYKDTKENKRSTQPKGVVEDEFADVDL